MTSFKLKFQPIEGKHYFDCQDALNHPLVNEAFKFGDKENKNYDSIEWDGSIYQAELSEYKINGMEEVIVGEWLGDV